MLTIELPEAVENEWYIVRHSGETPEIAFNSAIYQLTRAQDGPRLILEQAQIECLKKAAVDRYQEIVLRDLQHANSGTAIYRGIARSIVNYRRFCMFCSRQQLPVGGIRRLAAKALTLFLDTEIDRLQSGNRPCIINCGYQELCEFALELGVELGERHKKLAEYCPLCS
jgi:hypothetical protein